MAKRYLCKACGKWKPLSEFYPSRVGIRCKRCIRIQAKKWKLAQYLGWREQPDRCEACGVGFGRGLNKPTMDHDHVTFEFRGWLCQGCNAALGNMRDDLRVARQLYRYLKHWQAREDQ